MKQIRIGILAFHGDVAEHISATKVAAANLRIKATVTEVRTLEELTSLDALIIPGGESPTLEKLCKRAGMWEVMKKIPNIFGTCAGAILLAKKIGNASAGQETLGLMNIEIERNAYGRQTDSFEKKIQTVLGSIETVFIRAPRITATSSAVKTLAENDGEVVACEERSENHFYLAACFHPELTTTKFHEYFLRSIL